MPIATLDDRAIISVTGADAEHFLQNILTVDLDALEAGVAKPGALLSPQGKILFDFLISRDGGGGLRPRLPLGRGRRLPAPADALPAACQGRDRQARSGGCDGRMGK